MKGKVLWNLRGKNTSTLPVYHKVEKNTKKESFVYAGSGSKIHSGWVAGFILFSNCFIRMLLPYNIKYMITKQKCPVCHTFLTVWLSIFHVKEAIPKRLLTSGTDKATRMPSLS